MSICRRSTLSVSRALFTLVAVACIVLYIYITRIENAEGDTVGSLTKQRPPHPNDVGWFILAGPETVDYVEYVVSNIRRFYALSPITLLSDAQTNFSTVCEKHQCRFVYSTEKIGADKAHSPNYTCKKNMLRMLEATKWAKVPYMIMAETDTRVTGPLKQTVSGDVMQMANQERRVKDDFAQLIKLIFGRPHHALGYSTTGGTLYRSEAFIDAVEHQQIHNTALWKRAVSIDREFDTTEDMCLYATMLLSGYVIKPWTEYMQINGGWDCCDSVPDKPFPSGKDISACKTCIQDCQRKHCTPCGEENKFCGNIRHPVDDCVVTCPCPSLWHAVKRGWCHANNIYSSAGAARNNWPSRLLR